MTWDKDKKKKKDADDEREKDEAIIHCNSCGYDGTMDEFLQKDSGDTLCPQCGEDENLVFEI